MKHTKRFLALFLATVIFFTASGLAVAGSLPETKAPSVTTVSTYDEAVDALLEEDGETAAHNVGSGTFPVCDGNCGHCPAIVVPGIFQSKVRYLDDEGNEMCNADGEPLRAPFFLDIEGKLMDYILDLIVPMIAMLVTRRDCGFSETAAKIVTDVFSVNAIDDTGHPVNNIVADKYNTSMEFCTEEERAQVFRVIPLKAYAEVAGNDHLYFLSYNSFGNNADIADELYELIQTAKRETGHDKVNIIPVSLGGSIANALLEYHPEVYDDLNRIVYIVPALDGSVIIGDLMNGNFNTENEALYDYMFPMLVDENDYMGYLVNLLIRIIPKRVLIDTIDAVLESLLDTIIARSTCMWGLVPKSYYPEAREKRLMGDDMTEIRAQTDRYYQAQLNSKSNILEVIDKGAQVFDIVDYNYTMYPVVPSWDKYNNDGIIHIDSESLGATAVAKDVPLPDDYVEAGTHCTDPEHHCHISPERLVDASTGLLPETTFYFLNQDHESTGSNDVVMKLAVALIIDNRITDVYSDENFPQFNVGRTARDLINYTIPMAKELDRTNLSAEDIAELDAAIAEAEEVTNNTVVDYDAFVHAEERLKAILVKIGVIGVEEEKVTDKILRWLFETMSDQVYKYYGPRGYGDGFWMNWVED